MVKTVIGLFASPATAQKVVQDLVDQGFPRDDIRIIPEEGTGPVPTATKSVGGRTPGADTMTELDQEVSGESVAVALIEIGMPEKKAVYYSEAVRRGGTLVCVTVDESLAERAKTIIDSDGSLDINNQAAQWRQSGWAHPAGMEGDLVVAETTYVCEDPTSDRLAL
jgi:hypothetical protein